MCRHFFEVVRFIFEIAEYRTHATINRGYYYFLLNSYVGLSLMIGGIPLKMCSYKTRAVIIRAWLITACIRYLS